MSKINKGFTLIELLVAITIVGIISGIIINSSLAIQKSSRDAQRKSDLRVIQGALQQYYADQQFFPLSGAGGLDLPSSASLTSVVGNPSSSGTSKIYLDKIPRDPTHDSTPYCYKSLLSVPSADPTCDNVNGKCNGYYLCAKLENPETGSTACPDVVACPGYNFAISPL